MNCPKCEGPIATFIAGATKKDHFCLQCDWESKGVDEPLVAAKPEPKAKRRRKAK